MSHIVDLISFVRIQSPIMLFDMMFITHIAFVTRNQMISFHFNIKHFKSSTNCDRQLCLNHPAT